MPLFTGGGSTVTSANIVDGEIVNADVSASAAIDSSKLANLPYAVLTTATAPGGASTLTTSTFTAKKYLRLIINVKGVAVGGDIGIRFNGDTGANYNCAFAISGGANSKLAAQTMAKIDTGALTGVHYWAIDVFNLSGEQKSYVYTGYESDDMLDGAGHYTVTAGQITSVTLVCAGNITAGSTITVLGSDT